nr:uncharacterized protein [uncultured bacterium]
MVANSAVGTGAACVANKGAVAGAAKAEVEREAVREALAAKTAAAGKAAGGAGAKGVAAKGAAGAAAGAAGNAGTGTVCKIGAAKTAAGKAIWAGGLGLGLSSGAWMAIGVGALGALAVYGYMRRRKAAGGEYDHSETDIAIQEALS